MSAASRGARGQRAPTRGGGIFSRMSVAPMDSMPPIRTSFVRGLAGTWSSPVVVGAMIAWLLIEWLIVIALGYPGPFSLLADIAAPAPLSTNTDLSVSIGIFGLARGLPLVFITSGLVHALWHAIVVGLAVETVETGRASRWGAIRGLRAFPVSFAIHAFGVALFILSQIVAGIGGGSMLPDPPAGDLRLRRVGVRLRPGDRGHRGTRVPGLPRSILPGRPPARARAT